MSMKDVQLRFRSLSQSVLIENRLQMDTENKRIVTTVMISNLGRRWMSPGPNLLKATVTCMFLSIVSEGWAPISITYKQWQETSNMNSLQIRNNHLSASAFHEDVITKSVASRSTRDLWVDELFQLLLFANWIDGIWCSTLSWFMK
jgi:hypothetical protein